jgi:phosphatidylglycerophosphatase A
MRCAYVRVPSARRVKAKPRHLLRPDLLLAYGFGSGLAPMAPGTFGSLFALLLWTFVLQDLSPDRYLGVIIASLGLGAWLCERAIAALDNEDPSEVVWDEFVGQWIALLPLVLGLLETNPVTLFLGFLMFRLFDIWKPWPVRYFDQSMHGGWGVMLDDVIAGLYAALFLISFALLDARSGLGNLLPQASWLG